MASVLKLIQEININRSCIPEYHGQNSETNSYLGGGNGHDKKYKDLTGGIRKIGWKCCEQKINCVKHELDAHENNYCIPAEKYTDYTNAKKQSAEQYIII